MKKRIWNLSLIFLFLLIFFLSLRKIMDLDIGFHLRGGEWMLENKSFHRKDVFTYTVNQNEYIAMYWLYQILIFLTYKLFGYVGINFLNSILIIILFFLIYLKMKINKIPPFIYQPLIFLITFIMEIRFSVRPEIFTYIFISSFLIILDEYFYKNKDFLFLIPFLQILWVNMHGLFIIGLILITIYFLSFCFHKKTFDSHFFKYVFSSYLFSFLNPYNIKGFLFPFYLFTRLSESSIFKNAISEFTSPFSKKELLLRPKTPIILFYIFDLLTFLFLILKIKKRKIHEFLIILSFLYLSYKAVRNIPIFLIPSVFILANCIKDSLKDFKVQKLIFLPILMIILTIIILLRIFTNSFYYERGGGEFGIGIDERIHPRGAVNFILKNNLKGRILNDLNHGSWFIWELRYPVFIDGRLEVMKEKFFEKYCKSFSEGGILKLIEEYKPDMIIFDYSYPEALFWDRDLKSNPLWRIIYWDDKSVIFAHKDFAPFIEKINFMKVIKEMGIDTNLSEEKVWSILKMKKKNKFIDYLEGFYKRRENDFYLLKMAFYSYLSLEFKCSEILYLEALKRNLKFRKIIYFNLGSIYFFTGRYDKALYCYNMVLKEDPNEKRAIEIIKMIKEMKNF